MVSKELQEVLEYKVKTGTNKLEQKKEFLASVWQLHKQICEGYRQDHWGFPPLTFTSNSAKNLVCYRQMRSPGFWSSFWLIINKFKACRKWVVLSISGYYLFWQITLPDFQLQRWSVVRHQSRLRIENRRKAMWV